MIGMIRWSGCPTTGSFCLIPFVLAACITAVAAQSEAGVELANPAEENRVVISGAVQKGQAFPTFSGNILLKTAGKDRVDLRLRSTSLELDGDPRIVINRGDVSIPGGTTIEPGQARDVRITIANVSRPGLYRGKLRFWAAGADENKALEVPINLEIGLRPALALLGSPPQWNLVRCEWNWVCWLAQKTVATSATQDAQSFKLENQSALPVDRMEVLTLLRGINNKSNDAASQLTITAPTSIPGNGTADIGAKVNRNEMDADSYEGSVRVRLPGTDEALTVPLLVNVRNGSLIPLVLILAGIIVGRWARALESPEMKAQMKALQRFYVIRSDIARVRHSASVQFLTSRAAEIERLIERGSTPEQQMTTKLTQFEAQIDFLTRLDALEIDVAALKIPALSKAISVDIATARAAYIGGDETAAQQSYDAARKKIRDEATKPAPMLADGTQNVVPAVLLALNASLAVPEAAPPNPPVTKNYFAGLLGFVSGTPWVGVQVRYWLIRPLLGIFLLVALCGIGLYTLYVKVPTFGASGLYEYLGLFVWGLGADVAQRTLSGLQLPTR